jgi:transcriptional regulator with XRE-family HTH domain
VSIGDTLAEARRQAGLTLTQVSQETRIRESIIRSIERGDFSSCGGDFYARGHIRSIAGVVGVDPVPLIREYDEEHGAPGGMRAAQIFEPTTPIRIREPRNLHLGRVFAVLVLAALGFGAYHLYTTHDAHSVASPPAKTHSSSAVTDKTHHTAKPAVHKTTPTVPMAVIRLTAAQDCWVGLNSPTGKSLYEGTVLAGSTMTWHEKNPVSMVIGNPPGVTLTVNGKHQKMSKVNVVTLSINPLSKNPVTVS